MLALDESYGEIVSSSSEGTRMQNCIKKLLLVLKENIDGGKDMTFDVWLFRPNASRRGKLETICFIDVGSSESLECINAYFVKKEKIK